MARLFMTLGFLFLALGLFWGFGEKLGLGRLPGDFAWKRENYSIHMPLATCLLISLGLSLISWLWQYLRR